MTLAILVYTVLVIATVAIVAFVDAPYGRHARAGWGPQISSRAGWLVMESPGVVVPIAVVVEAWPEDAAPWGLLGLWLIHYGYRALVFPWLIRGQRARMPVLVVGLAFAYNVFNGWVNFAWITRYADYATSWWTGPAFVLGSTLFGAGFFGHTRSDQILRNLRRPGETGYRIPHGFLFRWVSCPNYLSEIVQWTGWALLTWSPAGLLFALYTVANLGPRALAHHRWYQRTFEDYPPERRALLPRVL